MGLTYAELMIPSGLAAIFVRCPILVRESTPFFPAA